MLIGELVTKTGISKDTIRFYEKINLISIPENCRRENNYKDYPETVLQKIFVIQKLKKLGLTLNEIQEMIYTYEEQINNCVDNIPKIKLKVELIDKQIAELKQIKEELITCIESCPSGCKIQSALRALNK